MAKIKCPSCDVENEAGTKHCSDCGAELKPKEPKPDERRDELVDIVADGFRKAIGGMAEERKKKGKKGGLLDKFFD